MIDLDFWLPLITITLILVAAGLAIFWPLNYVLGCLKEGEKYNREDEDESDTNN